MYRFDDERRQRLLQDALVANLLDGGSVETSVPERGETAGSASATTAAPTRVGGPQAQKSKAA